MTDRQMRHMISHVIAAAQPAAEKYYHVCWWEKAVQCRHARHTKDPHEIFFSVPGSLLLGELSAGQRDRHRIDIKGADGLQHVTAEACTGTPSYRSYPQDTYAGYGRARIGYKPRFFNVTLTPPPC